jgi:nucleoside-diphosphate-sugar epimerase
MRVLVTGHAGYIGSILAPELAAAGHDVVGLDTCYYEGCDLGGGGSRVEALRLDVRDVESEQLEGFDAVVHLAGLSNDPLGDLDPALTREINHEATVRLARAAREVGVRRFLFASSCSMYGKTGADDVLDETAPLRPLTAYAESKVRAEEGLAALADADFSPVYLRNATVYGVSPRLRIDLVLNNLVGWAYTTGRVRVLSDGTPWRPLVHVRDVARATAALLAAPRELVHDAAFNIGADGENYQVRELAEIVRAVVPDCEVEYAGSGDPDPRSYRVDFSKLCRELPDAVPTWTAERGAFELLEAYRAAGLEERHLLDHTFTRLRCLQRRLEAGELDPVLRWRTAVPAP